jgi:hypothetical protein
MESLREDLRSALAAQLDDAVRLRHELHAHPELSPRPHCRDSPWWVSAREEETLSR